MKTTSLGLDIGTPKNAQNVLDVIDAALDEHGEWFNQWHRSVVCAIEPLGCMLTQIRDVLIGPLIRSAQGMVRWILLGIVRVAPYKALLEVCRSVIRHAGAAGREPTPMVSRHRYLGLDCIG